MIFIRRYAPMRFSLMMIMAAGLLLTSCAPGGQGSDIATAVPVTGNNSAPLATAVPVTGNIATETPASSIPETLTPAVKVSDQPISNGTVTVDEVTSPGPGWIVIHINSGGTPGEIIGWSQVKTGVNLKVPVTVDPSKVTSVLYAMLHVDAGTVGVYEFPGPDKPVMYQGQMVSPAFAVTGGAGAAAAPTAAVPTAAVQASSVPSAGGYGSPTTASAPPSSGSSATGPATFAIADNPKLGKILVDSKGMTLYTFKKDAPGKSNCTGGCLENWPPLLISSGSPVAGPGVTGKVGQITRTDNGIQVTYNDLPLYNFAGDKAPGDANGQGIGNAWFAAVP
jgi:predicted lipoprotein with Yx(FWY)xxD motif